MAALTPSARLDLAAEGARRLHPDFDKWVPRESGVSIAWKNIPYQAGAWPGWHPAQVAEYERFLKPEGRVWIAGDQVSYLPGWQEGAIRSANYVVSHIATPETIVVSELPRRRAPDAGRIARG
jgi:monoamine oxidase